MCFYKYRVKGVWSGLARATHNYLPSIFGGIFLYFFVLVIKNDQLPLGAQKWNHFCHLTGNFQALHFRFLFRYDTLPSLSLSPPRPLFNLWCQRTTKLLDPQLWQLWERAGIARVCACVCVLCVLSVAPTECLLAIKCGTVRPRRKPSRPHRKSDDSLYRAKSIFPAHAHFHMRPLPFLMCPAVPCPPWPLFVLSRLRLCGIFNRAATLKYIDFIIQPVGYHLIKSKSVYEPNFSRKSLLLILQESCINKINDDNFLGFIVLVGQIVGELGFCTLDVVKEKQVYTCFVLMYVTWSIYIHLQHQLQNRSLSLSFRSSQNVSISGTIPVGDLD